MKFLRDLLHLPLAGGSIIARRRGALSRAWQVTVPPPRMRPAARPTIVDMHWHTESLTGRPVAQWHDHATLQAHRHVRLVSRPVTALRPPH